MVFQLLHTPKEQVEDFAESLVALKTQVKFCLDCFNLTEINDLCEICLDQSRNRDEILVVEDALDLIAFERIGEYKGLYHCLGGVISPVNAIGPQDLNASRLYERIKTAKGQDNLEIIIATNPNMEGEATAMYLKQEINKFAKPKITRIARGVPSGADLDYADSVTLGKSLSGRSDF
jgi:recombination protein RecR